ncbi:MAG: tetratricopeptide repeat protein [Deltaproteobacteria bacterium]|nr:tetratricopeptide repeat protein [Deltaproteobacteria bacterium]
MTSRVVWLLALGSYQAYQDGRYDQALQKFLDQQVEHPDDPEMAMRVGSAHYKMNNWAEAEKAFNSAALRGDDKLRGRAMYNLGNVAYRQGKLDEAIARYQAALDLDPNDEDAKFNLEFVRNELRRRMEEAQKRRQQEQQQAGPKKEERGAGQSEENKRRQAEARAGDAKGKEMSKEQAEQALRAIEEKRPQKRQRASGRPAQPQKDW